jgi:hypothetical protein
MPSNYIVARLSYCGDSWVVKYGYSSHDRPHWRVRAAREMLDANGIRGADEYVTSFWADEAYEQQVHRWLSRNRLPYIQNCGGGYSRETYSLGHPQLEDLLGRLGQPVPAAASSALRLAREQALQEQAEREALKAKRKLARHQWLQKRWSGVCRWFRSLHEGASGHPRQWLKLPAEHTTCEPLVVRLMSKYVGVTCQCGKEVWFDQTLYHDTGSKCTGCSMRHSRPVLPATFQRLAA